MDKFELACFLRDNLDFDEITRSITSDTGNDEFVQSEFATSIGEDVEDIDFDAPEISKDFDIFHLDHTQDRLENAVDDVVDALELSDGKVRIWRAIMVDADWPERGIHERHLGVCWSFDEFAAECHWGDMSEGKREIRLEGLVETGDIDWSATAYLNTRLSEEKEIHLKSTAKVDLLSANWISDHEAKGHPAAISAGVFRAGELAEITTVTFGR